MKDVKGLLDTKGYVPGREKGLERQKHFRETLERWFRMSQTKTRSQKEYLKVAHGVSAEVTDVIAADEHGDHLPVVLEINAL